MGRTKHTPMDKEHTQVIPIEDLVEPWLLDPRFDLEEVFK